MKTETVDVTYKGKKIGEVEIERFETLVDLETTAVEFFGGYAPFFDWLNKVYEKEVVRRTRLLYTRPKVSKDILDKVKKRMQKDPAFMDVVCKKLGVKYGNMTEEETK